MSAELVLGVDGGNTKTIALLARFDGTIVGSGRAGRADIYNAVTPAAAIEEIHSAATAALGSAGAAEADLQAAVFSLAGADWPEDFEFLGAELADIVRAPVTPTVINDSIGALRCGMRDGIGVSVVAGTYNAVGARGRDGTVYHLGFWPVGAGAYSLGRRALRDVYRAGLGLAPPTLLTERAMELYGVADSTELLHSFTRRGGRDALEATRLASVVLDLADEGDATAVQIVAEEAEVLASYARVAADRVGLVGRYPVVLAGGVFRHPSPRLPRLIGEAVPEGQLVHSALEPAAGALLIALDELGAAPDAEDRVRETLPGASLFATR